MGNQGQSSTLPSQIQVIGCRNGINRQPVNLHRHQKRSKPAADPPPLQTQELERTIDYVLGNPAARGVENRPFTAMYPDRIAEAR